MTAEDHPQASPEARAAIERAHQAKAGTQAIIPVVDDIVERVREVLEGNHFAALLEETMVLAARRKH